MFQKLSYLPYVFGSVLACAKSAHLFQKLYYSLCGLCLSLSSLVTLPQTVRLFYISLCSQAPQQQCIVLSFPSMRRHGHSHKLTSSHALRYYTVGIPFSIALHCMHYSITLWAYLSQTHRPIALHCMHYGITLWAYLSEPLIKDSHKRLSSTEILNHNTTIPCAPSHMITHYRYVRVTERYTETLHVKKMADLVTVSL